MTEDMFDDIRPYNDNEVREVIEGLLNDKGFRKVVEYIINPITWEQFVYMMKNCNTKRDFQEKVIAPIILNIVSKKSTSLTSDGWEKLKETKKHVIISNHRDIVLDAGILNILRFKNGLETTEVAIGDNLLIFPWINSLVRLNKSFIVKRSVTMRQMLETSKHLSDYINYVITEKGESIWLAQREGRAKDSNDRTQVALIKMLSLHNSKESLKTIKELNIIPMSLSYEYDPCDYLKAKEFQMRRDNPEYQKSAEDDLINMRTGIMGSKGNIHLQIGNYINPKLDLIEESTDKSVIVNMTADLIDKEIFRNYKFFPINYVTYDIRNSGERFSEMYTKEEKEEVESYIESRIDMVDLENRDRDFLRIKLLEMYSNTLINSLSVISPN